MYLFPKNEILLAKVLISTYACGMSPKQDMTESKNNSCMPHANVSVPTQSVLSWVGKAEVRKKDFNALANF